jgi:prepilin-type N-terminal cleavage/methylation domain-containing protein
VRRCGQLSPRPGFTLVEIALAVVMLGIITAVGLPKLSRSIQRTRVSRASYVVASDLERAVAHASRTRKTLRVQYSPSASELRVYDRVSDTLVFRRPLGAESEYKLESVSLSPPNIDIWPGGVANASLTITLSSGGNTGRVAMLRTGLVRVVP